jgi:hypothetical protein
MSRPFKTSLPALAVVLTCGCASVVESLAVEPVRDRDLDCSFTSGATCWTMAARFPTPRPEQRDSVPNELLQQPTTILASRADTTGPR